MIKEGKDVKVSKELPMMLVIRVLRVVKVGKVYLDLGVIKVEKVLSIK